MCVVQIGELVSQLSDEVKAQNKAIPWRIIKDTRNFYVHVYGSIDIPSVWDTLVNDIPALKTACEEILTHFCPRTGSEQASLDGNNGRSAERTAVKSTNRSRFGSDLCLRQPTDQKAGGSNPSRRAIGRISEPYIVWGTVFVQTKRHSLP